MKTKRQIRRNRKCGDKATMDDWKKLQRSLRWKAIGERAVMIGAAMWIGIVLGMIIMTWLWGRI